MSKVGPELSKFIKLNFPVIRKRSALWFFTNEIRNNLAQNFQKILQQQTSGKLDNVGSDAVDKVVVSAASLPITSYNGGGAKKISRNKILLLWKNMDPESKRKYFNMAEFDELRYKEQKSLWVSEVGALMMKHDGSLDKVGESAPTYERLQREFLDSLENLHKNYERMIQAESTKTLYKDAIKRADNLDPCLDTGDLISAIPKQHRPILSQPRRPPTAFVLFLNDNLERYKIIRRRQHLEDNYMKIAADEWAKLDAEAKFKYEERYQRLRDEYNKAMFEYKNKLDMNGAGQLVDQALREKRAFKKSLRKRLRDASILPLSIRNAFNFFLMDHKEVKLTDLTEVWRNLPEEQKMKYIRMSNADVIRYKNEIEAYREIQKGLSELIGRTKLSSTSPKSNEEQLSANKDDRTEESNSTH